MVMASNYYVNGQMYANVIISVPGVNKYNVIAMY